MPGGFIESEPAEGAATGNHQLLQQELENYRVEWESGVFRSIMDAFELCVGADIPFPSWLAEAVMDDLFYCYENRRRGGRMERKGIIRDASSFREKARYLVMCRLVDEQKRKVRTGELEQVNYTKAAKAAANILRSEKSDARGSWTSILDSYNSLKSGQD